MNVPPRAAAPGPRPSTSGTLPPPMLIGGHPALDFLNSAASPKGERVEWLADGASFVDWLANTGAIDAATAAVYRSKKFSRAALDKAAADARDLREWLRGFVQSHIGKALRSEALRGLEPLNDLLAANCSYRKVVQSGGIRGKEGWQALTVQENRKWESAGQLLQPLADSIASLVCTADFEYIRFCEGESCTLAFYDETRGRARRWCSMTVCGNRHKAAAHRAKLREAKP